MGTKYPLVSSFAQISRGLQCTKIYGDRASSVCAPGLWISATCLAQVKLYRELQKRPQNIAL